MVNSIDGSLVVKRVENRAAAFKLSWIQATCVAFTLGFGTALLGTTLNAYLINTWLVFVVISIFGLWLCHRTSASLHEPRLRVLGTFWMIKVAVTLALLYVGWIPELDPSSTSWGYDPQRYYYDARQLIEDEWNPIVGSNYQGILFYYAVIFYLFGHNPVNPALINSLVTLCGTLLLIRYAYHFTHQRKQGDWIIAGLVLVPEVLWYDVLTSRETLMAFLIIVSTTGAARYQIGIVRTSLLKALVTVGLAMLAILAVRTSMMFPVVVSIGAVAFLLPSQRKNGTITKVFLIILGISAVMAGPLIQNLTGGYDVNYLKMLDSIQSYDRNVAGGEEWGGQSIGLLLAPQNIVESILFLPPRMLLYLAAPLPNIEISIISLLGGSWGAWQRLMTVATSLMMIAGFPYVLAATAQSWINRKRVPSHLILPIVFWVVFAAVAGGNIIIHERYRVMFTLLLFTCMWMGYTRASSRLIQLWKKRWYLLMMVALLFYTLYKVAS
jgi:hypothetical protein